MEDEERIKLYLASAFQRQEEIRGYRDRLAEMGYEVTSRWLEVYEATSSSEPDPQWTAQAQVDVDDVAEADIVVSFTSPGYGRGGRHVEYGLAIAWKKMRIIVGPVEHVFHMLPGALYFNSPEEFLDWAGGSDAVLPGSTGTDLAE